MLVVVQCFHGFFCCILLFLCNPTIMLVRVHHLTQQQTSTRPNITIIIMIVLLLMMRLNHIRELREAKALGDSTSSIMMHWEEETLMMIRLLLLHYHRPWWCSLILKIGLIH